MRSSLSLKLAIGAIALVLLVAGATTCVMLYELGAAGRRDLVARDRELARMLAGLRTASGKLDFSTLEDVVGNADTIDLGLVYVLELDSAKKLVQGALNPRIFGQLDPEYRKALARGRGHVLAELARGRVARQGRIKEYALELKVAGGELRLGFDLQRIDRQIARQRELARAILAVALLLGAVAAVLVARGATRPIRRLARAMKAAASGDMDQSVEVRSHDELASLAGSFNRMMRQLRALKGVQELATGYLSAEVIERALTAGGGPRLPVEERAVTALAVILHDLERPAGAKPFAPRERLSRLNEYLSPILDAILRQQGTVIAIEDARVLAVWGMPKDEPSAELKALEAAAAARGWFEREVARAQAAGVAAPRLAAGVSTGRAAAGNIGSLERYSFTVVGEPVDNALAIAKMARPGEIWLAEGTYNKVGDRAEVRACPPLMLGGMDEPLPLYRLIELRASA